MMCRWWSRKKEKKKILSDFSSLVFSQRVELRLHNVLSDSERKKERERERERDDVEIHGYRSQRFNR